MSIVDRAAGLAVVGPPIKALGSSIVTTVSSIIVASDAVGVLAWLTGLSAGMG